MTQYKPKVLVDFDGVIHRYSRGWADGTAYDDPMPGAQFALSELELEGYEVVIFSTRDARQIELWMHDHDFPPYRITNVKEPAVAQIDDRAIHFTDWTSAVDELLERYPVRRKP